MNSEPANGGPQCRPDATEFERLAVGYSIRRSVVFGAWWYGMVLAWAGLAHLIVSAILDLRLDVGMVLMGIGGVIAGIGWLATSGMRFTRKVPAPVVSLARVKEYDRTNKPAAWATIGSATAVCLAIFFLGGKSPELTAIVVMLFVVAAEVAAGLLVSARIAVNRKQNYTRWLAKHHG